MGSDGANLSFEIVILSFEILIVSFEILIFGFKIICLYFRFAVFVCVFCSSVFAF